MTFYEKMRRSFFIGHKISFHASTNGKYDILSFASSILIKYPMLSLLYDKSGTFEFFVILNK